jgi:hypothetical protein
MNSAKMKAIMSLINDMDDDMLKGVDMKSKMTEMESKPEVKITKVAMLPKKPEMEIKEEDDEEMKTEDNEDKSLADMLPKEGDEEDPLFKLRKKFSGK